MNATIYNRSSMEREHLLHILFLPWRRRWRRVSVSKSAQLSPTRRSQRLAIGYSSSTRPRSELTAAAAEPRRAKHCPSQHQSLYRWKRSINLRPASRTPPRQHPRLHEPHWAATATHRWVHLHTTHRAPMRWAALVEGRYLTEAHLHASPWSAC